MDSNKYRSNFRNSVDINTNQSPIYLLCDFYLAIKPVNKATDEERKQII